jgi:hypothetical protein
MSISNSLYPSYPGNPQRLDPAYTEGDDTVAGATDYNKHDDEILKHQDLIKNLNTISGAGGGTGVSDHALLSNLSYASANHTGFQASLITGAGIAIVGTVINGTQDQNLFNVIDVENIDVVANSLTTELKIRTGAGISVVADNDTKTITFSAGAGTTNHSELLELDYDSSAHTGFQASLTTGADGIIIFNDGIKTGIDGYIYTNRIANINGTYIISLASGNVGIKGDFTPFVNSSQDIGTSIYSQWKDIYCQVLRPSSRRIITSSNLISNGSFASAADWTWGANGEWVPAGSYYTWAQYTYDLTNIDYLSQQIATTAGKTYRIELQVPFYGDWDDTTLLRIKLGESGEADAEATVVPLAGGTPSCTVELVSYGTNETLYFIPVHDEDSEVHTINFSSVFVYETEMMSIYDNSGGFWYAGTSRIATNGNITADTLTVSGASSIGGNLNLFLDYLKGVGEDGNAIYINRRWGPGQWTTMQIYIDHDNNYCWVGTDPGTFIINAATSLGSSVIIGGSKGGQSWVGPGGDVTIYGGDGGGGFPLGQAADGGDVTIYGGAQQGAGTAGSVLITGKFNPSGITGNIDWGMNNHTTSGSGTFSSLRIPQIGGTAGKYSIFQGGANTVDLNYTLPSAYPVTLSGNLRSTTSGILSFDETVYAPIDAPTFTGVPSAPTAIAGTNTTQIATTAFVNAIDNNARYTTVQMAHSSHTDGKVAGKYIFAAGQGAAAVSGTGTLYPQKVFYLTGVDFPTINGKATVLRIKGSVFCNDVAPFVGTFTFGLYPVTRPATSGGAGLCIYTAGTVVSGSNGAVVTNPAADSSNNAIGSDFAIPADGWYALAFVTTATVATNAHTHVNCELQMRNA